MIEFSWLECVLPSVSASQVEEHPFFDGMDIPNLFKTMPPPNALTIVAPTPEVMEAGEGKRQSSIMWTPKVGLLPHCRHGSTVTWLIPPIRYIHTLHSTNYSQIVSLGLKNKTKIQYQMQKHNAKIQHQSTKVLRQPRLRKNTIPNPPPGHGAAVRSHGEAVRGVPPNLHMHIATWSGYLLALFESYCKTNVAIKRETLTPCECTEHKNIEFVLAYPKYMCFLLTTKLLSVNMLPDDGELLLRRPCVQVGCA